MKSVVSIIVPVYKVEEYLVRCLDSLCEQSLPNIEILLIDDASPDRCSEICDEFAVKDPRFKVIHNKTNQGLSVARNIGIANSSCEWLMFVDGDDWVHEDFCKEAYECAMRYHVDLVMFRFQRIKNNEFFRATKNLKNVSDSYNQSGYKTKIEAMDLLHKSVSAAAWNKLYHKDLFKDICYPSGRMYEDVGTTYKTVLVASAIYYLDKVLYYKCPRAGSITTLKTKKALNDWLEMSMKRYHDLAVWGYPPEKLDVLLKSIAIVYCMKKKPDTSDAHYVFCANALRSCKINPTNFTWKMKILFLLFKYCRPLFELICFLYSTKVY